MASSQVGRLISGFVAILVGVILLPIIDATITDAAFTGTLATIASLITIMFGLGLVLSVVKDMIE